MLGVKRSPFPLGVSASPVERRNTDSRNGSKQSGKTHFSGSKRKHRVDMTSNGLEARPNLPTGALNNIRSATPFSKAPPHLGENMVQQMMMAPQSLLQLLARAAKDATSNGIIVYDLEDRDVYTTTLSAYEKSGDSTKITCMSFSRTPCKSPSRFRVYYR